MRRWLRLSSIVAAAVAASGCLVGARSASVYGRAVIVTPSREGPRGDVKGELIAVSADSLWVLGDSALVALPLAAADRVRVQQHGLGGGKGAVWTLIGGLGSAAALTIACSSVEEDCGAVFLGVAAVWAVVGGLAAASLESSSKTPITGPPWEGLRPYARFPQGLPDGLDRGALRPESRRARGP